MEAAITIGAYLPFQAVTTAPFGKTIKIRQCGMIVNITGWTASFTISDAPGGTDRLTLTTSAPTANGSSLQVVSIPIVNCLGFPVYDEFGNALILSALNVLVTQADLDALPVSPITGQPGDPTEFFYSLLMTDLTPFKRRWLYGPFTVCQG